MLSLFEIILPNSIYFIVTTNEDQAKQLINEHLQNNKKSIIDFENTPYESYTLVGKRIADNGDNGIVEVLAVGLKELGWTQ